MPSGLPDVVSVWAGTSQCLALRGDGSVVAWGCRGDDYGQCTVLGGSTNAIQVSAGDTHSLALRTDGTVVSWGCGAPYDFGQRAVPAGLPSVASIPQACSTVSARASN